MTTRMAPICLWCRHFTDDDDTCSAFPKGIPKAVWEAGDDHTRPLPGDHGLMFKARAEPPPGRPRDDLREAGEDHFYGPWSGGGKGGGGRPSKPGAKEAEAVTAGQEPKSTQHWDPTDQEFDDYVDRFLGRAGVEKDGPPDTLISAANVMRPATWQEKETLYVYRGADGKPVGYAHLSEMPASSGGQKQVNGVTVRTSARGKGYGLKLYDAIQDQTDVNLYEYIGQSKDFTPAGKAFATAWLRHRVEVEGE